MHFTCVGIVFYVIGCRCSGTMVSAMFGWAGGDITQVLVLYDWSGFIYTGILAIITCVSFVIYFSIDDM